MNLDPNNAGNHAVAAPPDPKDSATQLLCRLVGAFTAQQLRATAEAPGDNVLARVTYAAALRCSEWETRLARGLRHARSDLEAAELELADGQPTEHLLTGHHDHLLVLAHRHHEASTVLELLAKAWTDLHPDRP